MPDRRLITPDEARALRDAALPFSNDYRLAHSVATYGDQLAAVRAALLRGGQNYEENWRAAVAILDAPTACAVGVTDAV